MMEVEAPVDAIVCEGEKASGLDDFDTEELSLHFQTLRIPLGEDTMSLKARPGHLRLYGRQSFASTFLQAHVARRWQHFTFDAETKMDYRPKNIQQSAGLSCYYNTQNWSCIQVTWHETYGRVIDVVATDLGKTFSVYQEKPIPVPEEVDYIYLKVQVRGISYQYFYSFDGHTWQETAYRFDSTRLADEYIKAVYDAAFTGAFTGMFCADCLGTGLPADFDYFLYKELDMEIDGKYI